MRTGAVSQEEEMIARNRVETYVRAMFAIKGLGEPDSRFVLPMIDTAMSRLSANEVRHPDSISLATLGDIQGIVTAAKMPAAANLYGANGPTAGKGSLESVGMNDANSLSTLMRRGMLARSGNDSGESGWSVGASSRVGGDYQVLDLSSPQGLQHLSAIGWGSTAASLPYARAGLNYGTVKDLRNYDRNFTGQDVLKAAGDVKGLGFDVNDKRAMRNHATIRHYDNNADTTNDAEKKFKHGVDSDSDLQDLLRRRGLCTKPAEQKALDAQIEQHKQRHVHESGLEQRINDPKNHPKAKAAIKDDVDHILHRNRQDLKAERRATVGSGAARSDRDLVAAHTADEPASAKAQDKNGGFKKLEVASLTKNDQDDWGAAAAPDAKKPETPKIADIKGDPKKPSPKVADAKPSAGPKPA